jgi:hypothetical protein
MDGFTHLTSRRLLLYIICFIIKKKKKKLKHNHNCTRLLVQNSQYTRLPLLLLPFSTYFWGAWKKSNTRPQTHKVLPWNPVVLWVFWNKHITCSSLIPIFFQKNLAWNGWFSDFKVFFKKSRPVRTVIQGTVSVHVCQIIN